MVEIRITKHQVCLSACKECGNVRAWNRSKVGTNFIHCPICRKHTQQIDLDLSRVLEIPTSSADTKEKVRKYAFPYHRSEPKEPMDVVEKIRRIEEKDVKDRIDKLEAEG